MSATSRVRSALIFALFVSACSIQRQKPESRVSDEHISHMQLSDLLTQGPANLLVPGRLSRAQGTALAGDTPGLPASAIFAAGRLQASPRHAEWVKLAWEPGSSDSLMAWIVYPATSNAKTPVVVVIHEIFGLSTWVRNVADQVAADGFIAIAPDLISRVRGGPSTMELSGDSARKLIGNVGAAERNRGIAAVANGRGFSGGVAFYGLPYMNGAVPIADSLARITKPVMLLNGSKDARIAAAMPAIDSAMSALGKDYAARNYDGAVHGFLRQQDDPKPTRDTGEEAANLAATTDGWPRTIAFLKKNLGVK